MIIIKFLSFIDFLNLLFYLLSLILFISLFNIHISLELHWSESGTVRAAENISLQGHSPYPYTSNNYI